MQSMLGSVSHPTPTPLRPQQCFFFFFFTFLKKPSHPTEPKAVIFTSLSASLLWPGAHPTPFAGPRCTTILGCQAPGAPPDWVTMPQVNTGLGSPPPPKACGGSGAKHGRACPVPWRTQASGLLADTLWYLVPIPGPDQPALFMFMSKKLLLRGTSFSSLVVERFQQPGNGLSSWPRPSLAWQAPFFRPRTYPVFGAHKSQP